MYNIIKMNITALVKSKINSGEFTYQEMAEYIGISRVTLYTRLSKDNWKKGEIVLVLKLK